MLGQVSHMSGTARGNSPGSLLSRFSAGVRCLVLSRRGEAGEIDTLTLIIILLAPLVVLGGLAFVLIVAYVNRVSRVTAELESKPKPTVCPACGHKLVEIRKFCAECGASIWPPEPEPSGEPENGTREPE
ncbi:MAG: zinc-ribbon domain-containing protein [Dehalococcoidia bacterium]|nr:zinc-ribbon domain-containing protein [Dehalococcoidia bacterium]